MSLGSFLFLCTCLIAGYGMTYLSRLDLRSEERFFYGAVIGAAVATIQGLLAFLLLGMGWLTILLAILGTGGLGLIGWRDGRANFRKEAADLVLRLNGSPRASGHPWPLLLVLTIAWLWMGMFWSHGLFVDQNGLQTGYVTIWGDWAVHLPFSASFAYGDNRPIDFYFAPGTPLHYAFGVDFFAALLDRLGTSLPGGLVLSTVYLMGALPGVMYCAAWRLIGNRGVGALSVLIFACGGGLGFIYAAVTIDQQGWSGFLSVGKKYTADIPGYVWNNPVLAWLVPQRSTLFGFSLALIVVAMLWQARAVTIGPRPFLFAGVLTGIMPIFHVHGFGTALAIGLIWGVIERRQTWLWFAIPAVVLALPALRWIIPTGSASSISSEVGWLAFSGLPPPVTLGLTGGINIRVLGGWGSVAIWAWFWIRNLGLFVPLLLVAQFWKGTGGKFRLYFIPLWLWFLVPNIWIFQPWDWDNTKFFSYWVLFGSMLVAALLVRLASRGIEGKVVAAICVILLCAAGAADILKASIQSQNQSQLADTEGMKVAAWVLQNTPTRSVLVTAPEESVALLSGRRVIDGYDGHMWSLGVTDWYTRKLAVGTILRGDPGTDQLLSTYQVDYVVIGPPELSSDYSASVTYWSQRAPAVFNDGSYHIYKVR